MSAEGGADSRGESRCYELHGLRTLERRSSRFCYRKAERVVHQGMLEFAQTSVYAKLMIVARPEVEALHRYVAPLEGRRGKLRLDFNENTLGPSPRVLEAIRSLSPEDYAAYPEYAELVTDFASHMDLDPEEVAPFNGADAAIRACFDAFGDPGSVFLTTKPTFGYYQPCADIAGMKTISIPYEDDLSFPRAAMELELARSPRLCLICNPNNPTTTLLDAADLLTWARRFPDTLFVIDEIYAPYTGVSVLPEATKTHNVIALRSLSKSAGLAALRLGFVCGPQPLVERAFRVTGPYDINAFAVVAGRAALADAAFTDAYVREVAEAKSWTLQALDRLGVRHFSQGGNYALVWPKREVSEVEAALRQQHILVRSMAGKPIIDGSFRLSFGTRPQMKRFMSVFEQL